MVQLQLEHSSSWNPRERFFPLLPSDRSSFLSPQPRDHFHLSDLLHVALPMSQLLHPLAETGLLPPLLLKELGSIRKPTKYKSTDPKYI